MDHYTAIISVIIVAFMEVVAVCWLYGKITEWLLICQYAPKTSACQNKTKKYNNFILQE